MRGKQTIDRGYLSYRTRHIDFSSIFNGKSGPFLVCRPAEGAGSPALRQPAPATQCKYWAHRLMRAAWGWCGCWLRQQAGACGWAESENFHPTVDKLR